MSTRRIALTVLLASLFTVPAANAAPDWAPAVTVSAPANAYGGLFETRYQNGGMATESFLQVQSISPLQTTLHVGTLPPGGSYADQLTVPSSGEAEPTGAQLAVAPNGAAVAVWAELVGSNLETAPYRYRASYRPAGTGTWEAPLTIATDTERNKEIYEYLIPIVGADGTAAVGIEHIASKEKGAVKGHPLYRVDVSVHPPGGAWQAPVRITPESVSGESLALALDGHGDLTAAYTLRISEGATLDEDRVTAIVRRLPSSTKVWGPEENITGSEITHSVYALHLGENEAGDAVLTYQYGVVSKPFNVWGATRQGPNGSWTTPTQLVTGSSAPADADVAPDGMAYILYWFQGNSSGESCEGVLRGPAGGAFTPQRCVSPPNQDTFSGSIAFLGNDAYFAWTGSVPGEQKNATVQGSRWVDSASLPEVARNLDLPGQPYGGPTLVNDWQGSVVALFTNGANQTRAAAYDAGAPILLAAGIPATATAGQPVSFSSGFLDLWSGLGAGQPTWSFGDGAPAAGGTNVTHTFAAPGNYTITLSASDAFGNTTSSTYQITVGPAPTGQSGSTSQPGSSGIDVAAPQVTLTLPSCSKKLSKRACKQFQMSRSAWQTLTGQVTDPSPSSGIASIQVAVYLTSGKRIEALTGGRFRKTTKTKARKTFAVAKWTTSTWSLKLPKLKGGRYTILVRATDRAGHVSSVVSKTILLS